MPSAQPDRDWGAVRSREWQPTQQSAAEAPAPKGGASRSSGSGSRGGRDAASAGFRTDVEISAARGQSARDSRLGEERNLQRWEDPDAAACSTGGGSLTDNPKPARGGKQEVWDQFKVNEKLFGVVSTFKEDLSQYTTPLKVSKVPIEVRRKADRIAQEIDKSGWSNTEHDGGQAEDEEALWSSVPREESAGSHAAARASPGPAPAAGAANPLAIFGGGASDGGAGGALLASLRASAPAASEGGYRSLVESRVKDWWRSQRAAGDASVPPEAEHAFVCPFSRRVFGDVSQLVTHWAAALPRGDDFTSPCPIATELFAQTGAELRWSEMAAGAGFGSTFSVEAPRQGSVWAEVVMRLTKTKANGSPVGSVLACDFVGEAVRVKCWKRDQKVEHREVLECLAAGLALHSLSKTSSGASEPGAPSGEEPPAAVAPPPAAAEPAPGCEGGDGAAADCEPAVVDAPVGVCH